MNGNDEKIEINVTYLCVLQEIHGSNNDLLR